MFPGPLMLIIVLIALIPLLAAGAASWYVAGRIQKPQLALRVVPVWGGVTALCLVGISSFLLFVLERAHTPPPGAGNPWGLGHIGIRLTIMRLVVYGLLGSFVGFMAVTIRGLKHDPDWRFPRSWSELRQRWPNDSRLRVVAAILFALATAVVSMFF
jgi:hypothetical protein